MQTKDKTIWTPTEEWDLESFGGLKVVSASSIRTNYGMNLTIYGHAGTGKTTVASSIKQSQFAGKVLHVDAEGGTHVLAHDPNYKVVQVTDWSQMERLMSGCRSTVDLPFDVLVLDNMTEMQEINMRKHVGSGERQIQHYNKNTADMLAMTRTFRDLTRTRPVSVIFIAWDDIEKNESGSTIAQRVQFTPSLQKQFPGIVDNIGYLTVEANQRLTRKLSFIPTKSDAKLRRAHDDNSMQIPLELYFDDEPVLAHIIDTIIGGLPFPTELYKKRS